MVFANVADPAHCQTPVEAWVQRYNTSAETTDTAKKLAIDGSGNVIVAGDSSGSPTLSDWLIIKYTGAGDPVWTNRFNGPMNLNDHVSGIAADGTGNVFVTGEVTIKYSPSGVPLWTNLLGGSAIAVDTSGNVFVTGAATIKYSGAGVPMWTNVFDGTANAIVADASGNIFVTGVSGEPDGSIRYKTIAYSSQGVPLWTNGYSGPAQTDDQARAVAVDGNGHVFVTGTSLGIGTDYDYATIAYSSDGLPLWTNRYDGPASGVDSAIAVTVDGSGNVFVTGTSLNQVGSDYATIKYSTAGVPLWTNRYHGLAAGTFDYATALVVAASGNVFVTGSSAGSGSGAGWDFATIKYSNAGASLWTNRYDGPDPTFVSSASAIGADAGGNVFVTGTSASGNAASFATLKYSEAGALLWTNRFNDGLGNGNDSPAAVMVDSSGNVFVAGTGRNNYTTIKYSAAGIAFWTNIYSGLGNAGGKLNAMAVDVSGNVFVTGYSLGINGYPEYATIGYSGVGAPSWTNRYSGPVNGENEASSIAVDASGNVFVTGHSWHSGDWDYATIKYSSAGMPLWTNRYNGPGNYDDFATAVAVDSSGNVFVAGYSTATNGHYEYATIKYSGSGVGLWTNRYAGPSKVEDVALAIALDASGNIFVSGYSWGAGSDRDYATIKYSNAGIAMWTNRYNGPGNYIDGASAVAVDSSGNVLVTGVSYGAGGSYDYATIKYSNVGVALWTNRYNGPVNGDDEASSVAVDGSNDVFVTGYSAGNGTGYDYATIAYSSAGLPLWTNRYNGPANGGDLPQTKQSLALASDGSVYVTGASEAGVNGTAYDFATVKYAVPALQLTITRTVTNTVALSWSSLWTGFILQESTNLSFPNGWSQTSQSSVTNDGQISVTAPISAGPKFFRLKSP
jgi:uncharacterized delta-60 repeat protein